MRSKGNIILSAAAVFCQFLSVFPFAVLSEGVGFEEFVFWRFTAYYGVFAVFYTAGFIGCAMVSGAGLSGNMKRIAVMGSKIGIIVPAAAFIIVQNALKLSTGLYIYIFPAAVIMYAGGYLSHGRGYSDIFTRAWFALFFVSGVIVSAFLWLTHDEELKNTGCFMLCAAFGLLIILSAALTNQTNIDVRTLQRSGGMTVLPKGLRNYNTRLITAVGALIVGLCLFSKPIANAVSHFFKTAAHFLFSLIKGNGNGNTVPVNDNEVTKNPFVIPWDNRSEFIWGSLTAVLAAVIFVVIIKFRRQILSFFKEITSPLFKEKSEPENVPFADEITEFTPERARRTAARKKIKQLYKKFLKENDPAARYRMGYLLYLRSLEQTPFKSIPSDTTDVHLTKGIKAFGQRECSGALPQMTEIYNAVRYGNYTPNREELLKQEEIIKQICGM